MIGKELLSEVFGIEIINAEYTSIHSLGVTQNKQFIKMFTSDYFKVINIHELAYRCKEWAFSKRGCTLASGRYSTQFLTCTILIEGREIEEVQAQTEPEAIFKACQWILKQEAN